MVIYKFKHIKFDDTRILWMVGGVVWEKKVGGVILDVIGGGNERRRRRVQSVVVIIT